MNLRWWLLVGLVALLAACGQDPIANKDYASMSKVPMHAVCVGRMMVDLPKGRPLEWQQQFDYAKVSKLPTSVDDAQKFWALVNSRKRELERPTTVHPDGKSVVYRKYGENAAILLIRDPDAEELGYSIDDTERYLWLGQWGYKYETGALSSREAVALIPKAEKTFDQVKPISNIDPPAPRGFCIDSAMVVGKIGPVWSGPSVRVPSWEGVTVSAGASEDDGSRTPLPWQQTTSHKPVVPTPFEDLEMIQGWAKHAKKREDKSRVVSFHVLRKENKDVAGMKGQEIAVATELANGQRWYRFEWYSEDDSSGPDKAGFSLDLEAGANSYTARYASPPSEKDLLALWDAMLDSVKHRSGRG